MSYLPMLANAVFPAPIYPYMASLFWPIGALAALATELAIVLKRQKAASPWVMAMLVVLANLLSWVCGLCFADCIPWGALPGGLVEGHTPGPEDPSRGLHFWLVAYGSYIGACLLSALLEGSFYFGLARMGQVRLSRLPSCAFAANAASYLVLMAWSLAYTLR